MPGFLGRVPTWAAIVGIAVVIVGGAGVGGYLLLSSKPHVTVSSSAVKCATQPAKVASLFSDGQTTMIRLSNPDYTNMTILRTEPANVLPGMFESLLALTPDSSRLAYVTASDELLENAQLESIDVANPATRNDLAAIPKGLWTTTPAWSQDGKRLAFVRVDATVTPVAFQLWVADLSTQPATVGQQADLLADNFTNGNSASLCWTSGNRVVVIPAVPQALPAASTPSASSQPQASASPVTGSPCGVPTFSQNDPAWQAAVMKSGSDTIGGAGCALTSAAMLLNYYGSQLSPAQLNSCLGGGADPIDWKAVPACTSKVVTGGDRLDFTWQDLDALLASGRPAIVGMLRGQTGSHFVVVTSGGGGLASSYRITDPWDATTYKTLASYIDSGYTPTWIISFSGPGHNCGRLIKGVVPVLTGVNDGQAGNTPVTVHFPPGLKHLKLAQWVKLSGGTIDPKAISLPFNPQKLTDGTTFTDDGIYQLLVVTQAPSQPPVVQTETFTLDTVAPNVDLSLLNPRSFGDKVGGAGASIVSSKYPGIDKPGRVQVTSSDTLSGVKTIQTSLDGAPLTSYSNDTNFFPVLVVNQSGDHSLKIQSTDAAGNTKVVTKNFSVYGPPPPPPPPSPRPTPTGSCPTRLAGGSITAATIPGALWQYNISWSSSGGCAPFSGTIRASRCTVVPATGITVCQAPYRTIPITQQAGGPILDVPACTNSNEFAVYSLSLTDAYNQTTSAGVGNANATPIQPCIL